MPTATLSAITRWTSPAVPPPSTPSAGTGRWCRSPAPAGHAGPCPRRAGRCSRLRPGAAPDVTARDSRLPPAERRVADGFVEAMIYRVPGTDATAEITDSSIYGPGGSVFGVVVPTASLAPQNSQTVSPSHSSGSHLSGGGHGAALCTAPRNACLAAPAVLTPGREPGRRCQWHRTDSQDPSAVRRARRPGRGVPPAGSGFGLGAPAAGRPAVAGGHRPGPGQDGEGRGGRGRRCPVPVRVAAGGTARDARRPESGAGAGRHI